MGYPAVPLLNAECAEYVFPLAAGLPEEKGLSDEPPLTAPELYAGWPDTDDGKGAL